MSLHEEFTSAARTVENWEVTPSNDETFALYSLYKQASCGDVNIAKPSGLIAKAKFEAWAGRKGISMDDAKKQYIDLVSKLLSSCINNPTITMSLQEQFTSAADSVRNWKSTPSNNEKLALYSLYKQASCGDVNIAKPSGLVATAKFNAWAGRKGISMDDAKKQYIDLVAKLAPKYA